MSQPFSIDIMGVMRLLPHRYPFLLVDRVLECNKGKSIRAIKNVTMNEPFFPGHFPHRPVMPGVMIIEALAQACGILSFVTGGVIPGQATRLYFVGIDEARFRKPVVPGDQLVLCAQLQRTMRGIWRYGTTALVAEQEVAHAVMMVSFTPEPPK
jgi:3-hydroxyacyl-[acyl-carrier-protein] dehydratase